MKKSIIVFLEGGLVQDIISTEPLNVIIVDKDDHSLDPEVISTQNATVVNDLNCFSPSELSEETINHISLYLED